MAQLHTGWHDNSKVVRTGLAGMGLHAWSISYCDAARSDGFIPMGAWPSLPGAGAAVKALLVAGLWEPVDGGFVVHDYAKYNRLRSQIEAEQQEARQRQSRHRSRVTEPVTNGVSNGVTLARAGAPNPNPNPGVTLKRDTPYSPTPLSDADAQGAPPTRPLAAENESPPPKWEEIAPGQFRGDPNGVGDVSLLTVRCPRCERSMPVGEVENHECLLVPGEPVQAPPRRRGGHGFKRLFSEAEPVPPEVQAELDRMERERPTAEQIAAEVARLGAAPR